MQNRTRILIFSCWAMLIVLFSPNSARGCSIFYPNVKVGSQFRVRVTDRGRPIKSLQMTLMSSQTSSPKDATTISSLTDANGYADFSNLSPGYFYVTAGHDAGIPDGADIEVVRDGPANVTVSLKWPSTRPAQVRSMSGVRRGPEYYPSQVQGELSLSLLEGVSARVVSTAVADNKGRFTFSGETPPGFYFLRINPSGLLGSLSEPIEGLIAIDFNPGAKAGTLDLDLGWSSCGLGYAQRARYHEIQASNLCGKITDVMGAVIPRAQVILLAVEEDAEILGQTQSGVGGDFALSQPKNGTYQLLVKSPGFRPYLRAIRVKANVTSRGCQQPISLKMDFIG